MAEMVWENFEGPQLPDEDTIQVGELNRKIDNDNVRMCFSWKPVDSEEFQNCNFFIRNWGEESDKKEWDGVKEFTSSDPLDWCSLNWSNPQTAETPNCKLVQSKNAYNPDKKTLTLQWERELDPSEYDETYDVQIHYGIFNHDGEENPERLKGGSGENLQFPKIKLMESNPSVDGGNWLEFAIAHVAMILAIYEIV